MAGPIVHLLRTKGKAARGLGGRFGGARKGIPPRAQAGGGVNTCSADAAEVFTLGLNVFTFSANVFSFPPNVFSSSPNVFTRDPVRPLRQGTAVRRDEEYGVRGWLGSGRAGARSGLLRRQASGGRALT